jgi:hypothetical protein
MKCPACGLAVAPEDNPFRPFCSDRCKLMDLGTWASEGYCISTPTEQADESPSSPDEE